MLIREQDKWKGYRHRILGESSQTAKVCYYLDGELHFAVLFTALRKLGLDVDSNGVVS
jgi:hypothetical protein